MRVFVLCTGRTGSTTVARAFAHATNFTSGHESRASLVEGRLDFPDDHVEADNRLTWFLGGLELRYGGDPLYVHLTRDREQVVSSFMARWEDGLARSRPGHLVRHPRAAYQRFRRWLADPEDTRYPSAVRALGREVTIHRGPLTEADRRRICEFYVDTCTDNITAFLRDKPNVEAMTVESLAADIERIWRYIGAEGDLDAALSEASVRHNRYLS